jgi:D-arabinose 1-dehydrogenase-like Zn-dependent alcohol dehydrogenase
VARKSPSSTTEKKRPDALDKGAVKYVNVNNPEELKDLENSFRVILRTIPANMTIIPIQTQHEAYDKVLVVK